MKEITERIRDLLIHVDQVEAAETQHQMAVDRLSNSINDLVDILEKLEDDRCRDPEDDE